VHLLCLPAACLMKKVGSGNEAGSEQAGGWDVENASGKSWSGGRTASQERLIYKAKLACEKGLHYYMLSWWQSLAV
jgi:hypothetical protein